MKKQMDTFIPSEIMTVRELALYLKTSNAKVYHMARTRSIPAFRIGKSWRFKKEMVDQWILRKMDTAGCLIPDLQLNY